VDALSHALIAAIILLALGLQNFIPFAVIGAVIPDADIFFSWISDRSPRLYLFTHGGIAHSIAGAMILSVTVFLGIGVVRATGFVPSPLFAEYGIAAFLIMVAAAFLHLFIDFLACPGIPILAPFSDRKYTPGILPGPSILVTCASVGILVPVIMNRVPMITALTLYAVIVVLYLACRMGTFLFAAVTIPGRRVPMINPFRWLVIAEDDAAFTVRYYTVFRGFNGAEVIEKFKNTDAREIQPYLDMPEVRRLKFNSYIMTVEKDRSSLVFRDPLRGKGYIWYPHKFRQVSISIKDEGEGLL
jgi:inner membrane protein